jgi:hypothetical protein
MKETFPEKEKKFSSSENLQFSEAGADERCPSPGAVFSRF